MLNYIWAGLIILSLLFATVQDSYDLINNTYKNGTPKLVQVDFPDNQEPASKRPVSYQIPGIDTTFQATWRPSQQQSELIIPVRSQLPSLWQKVAENQSSDNKDTLRASIVQANYRSGETRIMLPEVKFVKMRAITEAAFNMAEFAVDLVIGLIGLMALWLGLMKIAEKSGLIQVLNRAVQPVLKFLFPDIPRDHPAYGAISLNLAANVLGLGNAATPLGIKAMEELQKLNENREKATDAMCMFLAINTSSVQLLPPVTLLALMGTEVNQIMIAIILATSVSTIVGIAAAKWLAYRHRNKTNS